MEDISNYRVSLIVPTFERCQVVTDLIRHISSIEFVGINRERIEIILIDQSNSPCKDLLSAMDECKYTIKYLRISHPSLPNARNVGIRESAGDICIFIDDDVRLNDHFLHFHLKEYTDEKVCAVAGKVTEHNLTGFVSLRESNYRTPRTMFGISFLGLYYPNRGGVTKEFVYAFPGGNFSIRKKIVSEIGLFDTRYKGSGQLEETDFAYRLRRKGYKIAFSPYAEVIHLRVSIGGCRTISKVSKWYWRFHNTTLFMLKNKSLITFPIFLISFTLIGLWLARKKKPFLRNYLHLLKGIGGGFTTFLREKMVGTQNYRVIEYEDRYTNYSDN